MGRIYKNTLKVVNLRGHTNDQCAENFDVDLSAILIKKDEKQFYVIPGSSIKGVIRKNMKILGCDTSFLGPEFGKEGNPSKVIIGWGYAVGNLKKQVRYGIKINKELGTVEKGALFSYELIPSRLDIVFEVRTIVDLSKEEKECLKNAILLMKYSTIGWGGSRGIGVVEEVKLDDALLS